MVPTSWRVREGGGGGGGGGGGAPWLSLIVGAAGDAPLRAAAPSAPPRANTRVRPGSAGASRAGPSPSAAVTRARPRVASAAGKCEGAGAVSVAGRGGADEQAGGGSSAGCVSTGCTSGGVCGGICSGIGGDNNSSARRSHLSASLPVASAPPSHRPAPTAPLVRVDLSQMHGLLVDAASPAQGGSALGPRGRRCGAHAWSSRRAER